MNRREKKHGRETESNWLSEGERGWGNNHFENRGKRN